MGTVNNCQAQMLLDREYRRSYQSLVYNCMNDMIMHVAVDNISVERIAEIDKDALESIKTQECFKCPYLHQGY